MHKTTGYFETYRFPKTSKSSNLFKLVKLVETFAISTGNDFRRKERDTHTATSTVNFVRFTIRIKSMNRLSRRLVFVELPLEHFFLFYLYHREDRRARFMCLITRLSGKCRFEICEINTAFIFQWSIFHATLFPTLRNSIPNCTVSTFLILPWL